MIQFELERERESERKFRQVCLIVHKMRKQKQQKSSNYEMQQRKPTQKSRGAGATTIKTKNLLHKRETCKEVRSQNEMSRKLHLQCESARGIEGRRVNTSEQTTVGVIIA